MNAEQIAQAAWAWYVKENAAAAHAAHGGHGGPGSVASSTGSAASSYGPPQGQQGQQPRGGAGSVASSGYAYGASSSSSVGGGGGGGNSSSSAGGSRARVLAASPRRAGSSASLHSARSFGPAVEAPPTPSAATVAAVQQAQQRKGAAALAAKLDQTSSRVAALTLENESLRQQVQTLLVQNAGLTRERDTVVGQLAETQTELEAERSARTADEEISSKYDELCAMVAEMSTEKEQLQLRIGTLSQQLEAERNHSTALESRLLSQSDNAADQTLAVTDLKRSVTALRERAIAAEAAAAATKAVCEQATAEAESRAAAANAKVTELMRQTPASTPQWTSPVTLRAPTEPSSPAHLEDGALRMSDIGALGSTAGFSSPVARTVVSLSEEAMKLAGRLRTSQQRESHLQEQLQSTQAQAQSQFASLEANVQTLQRALASSQSQVAQLEAASGSAAQSAAQERQRLQAQIEKLQAELAATEADKIRAQQQHATVLVRVEQLEDQQAHISRELTSVLNRQSMSAERTTELEAALADSRRRLEYSTSESQDRTALLDQTTQELRRLQDELVRAKSTAEAAGLWQAKHAACVVELHSLQERLDDAMRREQVAQAKVSALEVDLLSAHNQLNDFQARVSRVESEETQHHQRLRAEVTRLQNSVDYLQTQRHGDEQEIKSLRQRLAAAQGRISGSQSELDAAHSGYVREMEHLRAELANTQRQLQNEQQSHAVTIAELEATRRSVNELREHVNGLRAGSSETIIRGLENQVLTLTSENAKLSSRLTKYRITAETASGEVSALRSILAKLQTDSPASTTRFSPRSPGAVVSPPPSTLDFDTRSELATRLQMQQRSADLIAQYHRLKSPDGVSPAGVAGSS